MFSAVAGNSGVTKRDTSSHESHHHCLKIPTYKVVIRSSSRSSTRLLLFVSPYCCEVVMTRVTFSFIWCDWCDLFWGMGEIEGKDEVRIPHTFSWWQEPWSCHNSSIRRSGSSCEFLPRNAWRNTRSPYQRMKMCRKFQANKQSNQARSPTKSTTSCKIQGKPNFQSLENRCPQNCHQTCLARHGFPCCRCTSAGVVVEVFSLWEYHVSYPAKSSNTLSIRKGCDSFFCKLSGGDLYNSRSREILCVLKRWRLCMLCMLQAPRPLDRFQNTKFVKLQSQS